MVKFPTTVHRALALSACLLTSGLLGGCGGGGGSPSAPTDTTPPTVASVIPADKATGVSATASVTVTFSEAVDCAKAGSDALVVTQGGISVPGALSCSGSTLSFKPTSSLPTSATLTAMASAGVTDLAGNRLGTAYVWQFSVPPWTVHLGSSGADAFNSVASDASGSFYVAGSTAGSVDTAHPTGGALLVKYDAQGSQQWVRQIGARLDAAQSVAIDTEGNVFVGGRVETDPLAGNPGLANAIFIAKYDKNGTRLWVKQFSSGTRDFLRALQVDGSGNVIAVGYTQGRLFGASGGGVDFFVVKLDGAGAMLWGVQDGGPGSDNASNLAVSAAGDIFVVGYAGSALHGLPPSGGTDAFLIKYAADGTRQWMQFIGSPGEEYGESVNLDPSGNLDVLGRTSGALAGQSSAGGLDAFVAKLDATGAVQWIRQFGTAGDDYPNAMVRDASGGLRVAGYTTGAFAGASHGGGLDGFVAKLDAGATLQWVRQWGGVGDEYVYGLVLDAAGNAFVTSMGAALPGIAGAGDLDAFLLKFASDGTPR